MSREPDDPWELPKEEEPDWAEEIRRRRKARGERYRQQMADDTGERAEPPVDEPPPRM